jgi:hypothetical protein
LDIVYRFGQKEHWTTAIAVFADEAPPRTAPADRLAPHKTFAVNCFVGYESQQAGTVDPRASPAANRKTGRRK